MRLQPRTIVLAVVVAVLGAALVVRFFPSSDAKAPPSKTARTTKKKESSGPSSPNPREKSPERPTHERNPIMVTAAQSPSDAPPSLEIPDLTSQLPPDKLSQEPDPRQVGGFRGEIFMRLDENGDLRLDRLEIPEFCREQMIACDANDDGKIDFAEFNAAIPKLPSPAARTTIAASALVNPPEPGQEIPTYEPQLQKRSDDVPMWFAQLDKSKDGHIAIYEWPPGRLMEFRALDLNDDGFITLEEAKKGEAMKNANNNKRETVPAPSGNHDRASTP